jgi:hypothetical protein
MVPQALLFFYYIILLPVEELLRSLVLHKSRIVILLRNLGALRGKVSDLERYFVLSCFERHLVDGRQSYSEARSL